MDQAVLGKANVVTVQVEYDPNTGVSTIIKSWGQDATVVGPNIEAGTNYAIRLSDETPTQEVSAVANIKFKLLGLGLQLGIGASQEGNLGSSSGPLDFQGNAGVGPGSGQLSTDGWEGVNVDLVGVGAGTAMTTGMPWQISDPNSIPDKAIFDTIINEISKRNGQRTTAVGGAG